MSDPYTVATIIIAVAGTAQQVRVTNATNRINQWQAKEEGRKAHLQSTQREVDRLQKLRKTLAQNNVQAASSGVSLTSETVQELKAGSIKQFESDQLTDRVNTNSFVSNLKATSAFNSQIANLSNQGAAISAIGTITKKQIDADTKEKIKSMGG